MEYLVIPQFFFFAKLLPFSVYISRISCRRPQLTRPHEGDKGERCTPPAKHQNETPNRLGLSETHYGVSAIAAAETSADRCHPSATMTHAAPPRPAT